MAIPIDNEGYYMDARYRSQFYNKKSFEANIDVPDTEIKK